jgi:hypothetical protein
MHGKPRLVVSHILRLCVQIAMHLARAG